MVHYLDVGEESSPILTRGYDMYLEFVAALHLGDDIAEHLRSTQGEVVVVGLATNRGCCTLDDYGANIARSGS